MGSLFVVSDVHGYRDDLAVALRDAGLLDDREQWCGEDADLWVLGDLLDRGPDGVGVIDLVMSLQETAPGHVHVLMGNHEALAIGVHDFPYGRFADSWQINGGLRSDQDGLTERHLDWLRALPAVALVEPFLLTHSDTTEYLTWGRSVDEINASVSHAVQSGDEQLSWQVWAKLTSRYDYAGPQGERIVREVLGVLGGEYVVHGHSMVGILTGTPSHEVKAPVLYAGGLALGIDGGRYDDGPLLVVRLR